MLISSKVPRPNEHVNYDRMFWFRSVLVQTKRHLEYFGDDQKWTTQHGIKGPEICLISVCSICMVVLILSHVLTIVISNINAELRYNVGAISIGFIEFAGTVLLNLWMLFNLQAVKRIWKIGILFIICQYRVFQVILQIYFLCFTFRLPYQ